MNALALSGAKEHGDIHTYAYLKSAGRAYAETKQGYKGRQQYAEDRFNFRIFGRGRVVNNFYGLTDYRLYIAGVRTCKNYFIFACFKTYLGIV